MGKSSTGLPDSLKTRIESLSGMNLDDVRVHYNSPKPAQLGASAFTSGNHIHLGPGQQGQLAHEAWHVVQQAKGRVSPTGRSHIGLGNDDAALEVEADLLARRTPG
ncbi:DUF4157 domain-containing protein [Piscinibacter sakaiensis]|uniref:eCIS core domain-containing protein n=1 Tax=Piscinibacter sakaiensis TaxID=1547922 RepID=UPI003AAB6A31